MSVDREEVERIGRLAKLRLTDDEADRLTDEMNRILEHAERLRGLEEASGTGSAIEGGETESGEAAEREADERDVGGERLDEAWAADPGGPGPSGTRSPAAETPDPLRIRPSAFAPDVRMGFFVVPPPPGVMADDDGADGGGGGDGVVEETGGGEEARADDAGGREG